MPARKATELTDLIKKLRTIRRQHEQALGEIETTFRKFGIEHLLESTGSRKRGAAAGSKAKAKGKAKARVKALLGAKAVAGTKGKAKAARKGKGRGKVGRKARAAAGKDASTAPAKKAKGKVERRKRAKYTQTGDEFILSFLGKKGNATTNEIRQHWKKQGRKGKAENNLTGLVKSGKVLRNPTPGQAGSTYSLPAGTPPSP